MPLPTVPGASAPFRLSSSPLEAFAHPSWERAECEALAALARGDRALLLGPAGTGKTLLLQDLERTLRARRADARVLRQGEPLAAVPDAEVLFVDEAGGFSDEELERICRRPNGVVMAGLPCLQQRIERCAGPIDVVTLEPLSPQDVARFVVARLGAAGRSRDVFTPEALAALARHSGGLLRLVIVLAGAALFFAELRVAARVAASDVDEAAAMRAAMAEEAEPEPSRPPPLPAAPLSEAPLAEPSWLQPVMSSARTRFGPVARLAAGLAGVACAALAVAALAIAAALAVSSAPAIPLSLQALNGGSAPPPVAAAPHPAQLAAAPHPAQLAAAPHPVQLAAAPHPVQLAAALHPAQLAAAPQPVQLAAVPPPVQLAAAPPPAPNPAPPPAPNRAPPPASAPALAPALAATSAPEPALAQVAVPSPSLALPPPRPAPPDPADRPAIVLAFSGPIMNDTMGQGGRLSLQLRTDASGRPVGAWFHASHGLIGTGTLSGHMGPDGRITLSGRLMMGRNPFDCALKATLDGDRLVGEATFVRAASGATAHSSFTLSRLQL